MFFTSSGSLKTVGNPVLEFSFEVILCTGLNSFESMFRSTMFPKIILSDNRPKSLMGSIFSFSETNQIINFNNKLFFKSWFIHRHKLFFTFFYVYKISRTLTCRYFLQFSFSTSTLSKF